MRVTVLVENCTPTSRLAARHGLSLLLEPMEPDGWRRRILFDFGPDDALLANSAVLGVDLCSVDAAVLSHGHYDHGGGLGAFLFATADAAARVYVREGAFVPRVSGTPGHSHPVGIDAAPTGDPRVVTTGMRHDLGDGLTLFSVPTSRRAHPEPASNASLFEACQADDGSEPMPDVPAPATGGAAFVPDAFLHEQSLLVTEPAPDGSGGLRRLLVSGCSHAGILNVMDEAERIAGAPLDAVVAGLHLTDPSGGTTQAAEATRALARELARRPRARYHTLHCTGLEAYSLLRDELGGRVDYLHVGSRVEA